MPRIYKPVGPSDNKAENGPSENKNTAPAPEPKSNAADSCKKKVNSGGDK